MTRKYSDGAKALIGTLIAAGFLAVAAISVLIISLVEPSRGKIAFNVPEFTPEKTEKKCHFEKPIASLSIEGLEEWLQTSTVETICIRKKQDGFWIIYPFELLSKNPA